MDQVTYWVYILTCNNGSYYTGYTNDVKRRYQEHVNGTAKCKYTRSFKPLNLAQCWKIGDDKALAMKVESCIKKLSKQKKQELILYPERLVFFIQQPLPLNSNFRNEILHSLYDKNLVLINEQ